MSIATFPDLANDYPTTDGRPMAETDIHRSLMMDLISTLQDFYAEDDGVYVSGNLLVFYVPGDRRRHLSPDVFVVKGVAKHARDNYLIWKEGRGPDVVIELTSASTRDEDVEHKMTLYRDVLRVPEYFLFDPRHEYLDPPFQGFRLHDGQYVPIEPVDGRLPSEVLGLHLERDGRTLRLYDPATGRRLLTANERTEEAEGLAQRERLARVAAEAETIRECAERRTAEATADREKAARIAADAEIDRLRRELEQARRSQPMPPAVADGI